jgi:hypothetical protein
MRGFAVVVAAALTHAGFTGVRTVSSTTTRNLRTPRKVLR